MTVSDVLLKARQLMATADASIPGYVLDCLYEAANGDGVLVAEAVELLDLVTPRPWGFFLWSMGGEYLTAGDFVGVAYRHDRPRTAILSLVGKALLREVQQAA